MAVRHARWLSGILLALACMAHAAAGSLSTDSLAGWRLTIDTGASAAERYAAEELQRVIREASGHTLPIETGGASLSRAFVLRVAPSAPPADESAHIRVEEARIVIEGSGERGLLYGVYEFAETHLGARFLTADHAYVPRVSGRSIPLGETRIAPAFSFRSCFYAELTGDPAFAARRRINTVPGDPVYGGATSQPLITHSLFRFVPVAEYGVSHPEYFALADGIRKLDADGGGPQVCSTQPGVIECVARGVLAELAAHPELRVVYVSQNDNGSFCECPNCAAIDEREGTHMGAHLTLVNAVAARVAEKRPDVKVGTLAYWYTRRPPRRLKPAPNVQIQFCAFEKCPFHAIADRSCPRNRSINRDLKDWIGIASEVYAWDYVFNLNAVDMPFADLHTLGPNLRHYAKRGVRGVFVQGNGRCPGGEFAGLRSYVISALLWNPYQDAEPLIDEFVDLHYGPAAGAVTTYLESIRGAARGRKTHASILSLAPELGLTAEGAKRGLELFDTALAASPGETYRARVTKASLPAYKAAIETAGVLTYARGRLSVQYPQWMESRFQEYAERCAAAGMDRSAEFAPLDEYIDDVNRNRAGVEAIQLENETWRVTLVPPMYGTVVELFHKPGKRDLLNAMGRPGINLRHGVLRETVSEGFDAPGSFEWDAEPASVSMVQRLPTGSSVRRTIALEGDTLRFATDIDHAEDEPRSYRVEVSAGFRAASRPEELRRVKGYAHSTRWRPLDIVSFDTGDAGLPEQPDASGVAWTNPREKSGAVIRYATGQFEAPMLLARPGLTEVSAELVSPKRSLRRGESYRIEYTVEAGPAR